MPIAATLALLMLQSNQSVVVSTGPSVVERNSHYVGNQAPLAGTPFIKLPVGAIKPRGWVLEYLKRQRSGLTGNLGKISAWLEKDDNAWLSKEGKGKWGWEEVPYWLKGYADLGYLLGDKAMIAEAKLWLDGVLSSQREDGNFGPTQVDDKGVEDFWPKMIMLYCLQSYYEYKPDRRILEFMTRFFRYQAAYPTDKFMQQYWQSRRTGDNLHSVIWLYNLTRDSFLLDLATKLHERGVNWKPKVTEAKNWFASMPDWHNVNIAQGFREPAQYSQLSKKQDDVQSTYEAFHKVREHFGQVPGGMWGGDENSRQGYADPRQGVEACGMVEQMNSDEELLRITGDVFWADHAENVAFNTYPAAVMPDFRSLRYITSPNMVVNDDKDHSPGIANKGPFLMMNPFSSRCCQHNHAMGWPYYAQNLWQATSDNGVAAVLYAASDVSLMVADGVPLKVNLKSNYPFEDNLTFKIKLEDDATFPFYLRIPAWCSNPELSINGKDFPTAGSAGKYLRIDRKWSDRDTVVLKLPMQVSTQRWDKNGNSVSVNYGPLTFSLKIGERYEEKSSLTTAVWDAKWQPGADAKAWPSFEIHPTTPWNYGLDLGASSFTISRRPWPKDDFPFTLESCPISLSAKGRRMPEWKIDEYGLCGVLPPSPATSSEALEDIELVPMGAARLRISAFPVLR